MKANLAPSLTMIFGSEGGYTNDPADSGGPTKFGITVATLAAWRKAPQTADDVKALTLDEAQAILATEYAAPIRFDDLPAGVDYCVLDFAVNSGPATAAKHLQSIVGATVDGAIGAKTLAGVQSMECTELIDMLCDNRLTFMRSLSNWQTFGKGWTARVEAVRTRALAMAVGSSVAPTISPPTAKASAANVMLRKTTAGVLHLLTGAGAAATIMTDAAHQLAPYSSIKYAQWGCAGFTGAAVALNIIATLNRLRSGQAAV